MKYVLKSQCAVNCYFSTALNLLNDYKCKILKTEQVIAIKLFAKWQNLLSYICFYLDYEFSLEYE